MPKKQETVNIAEAKARLPELVERGIGRRRDHPRSPRSGQLSKLTFTANYDENGQLVVR